MPIPDLVDNVLPEGVHDCTIDEVAAVFGRFQRSARRMDLTEQLRQYVEAARRSGMVQAAVIDGSYVTAKDEPEDVDLLVVLPAAWVWPEEIKPFQYNVVTKNGIRRSGYPFDALIGVDGTEALREAIAFFSGVNPVKHKGLTTRTRKGVLRVTL